MPLDYKKDKKFLEALKFVFEKEGGFVDDPDDQRTNLGVTQDAYNAYNKSIGEPLKDVKNITKGEAIQLYYKDYWLASGCNKLSKTNPALAELHFDSYVMHNPPTANDFLQKSGGNIDKYIDARIEHHKDEVKKKPNKAKFLPGWLNRANEQRKRLHEKYPSERQLTAEESFEQAFNSIQQELKTLTGGIGLNKFLPKNLTPIKQQPEKVFTREEIGKMSSEEFSKNEKAIFKQLNTKGIPKKSGNLEGKEKSSGDSYEKGRWVTINGNHVFLEK